MKKVTKVIEIILGEKVIDAFCFVMGIGILWLPKLD